MLIRIMSFILAPDDGFAGVPHRWVYRRVKVKAPDDDGFRRDLQSVPTYPIDRTRGEHRVSHYTFDVVSSLDGFGATSGGRWTGYWGRQGPKLLDHRLASYARSSGWSSG